MKFKGKKSGHGNCSNRKIKKHKEFDLPPLKPERQHVPRGVKELMKLKAIVHKKVNTKTSNPENDRHHTMLSRDIKPVKNSDDEVNKNIKQIKNISCLLGVKKRKNKKKLKKFELKKEIKQKAKKEAVELDDKDFHDLLKKDVIPFGETIHRPPNITVRPRKVAVTGYENRPGRKDDLLLKSLLKNSVEVTKKKPKLRQSKLSPFDQRQIETEKQKAILAYKNMKIRNAKKLI